MEITKVLLQERLKVLLEERVTAQAQVYGYDGAMQEAQHWLEELDKDIPEVKLERKPELASVPKE